MRQDREAGVMQRFKAKTYGAAGMKDMAYPLFAEARKRWPMMDWSGKFIAGAPSTMTQAARYRAEGFDCLAEVSLGASTVIDGRRMALRARWAFDAAREAGLRLP
jgi:hypothetical protein